MEEQKKKKTVLKKWWFWVIVAVVLIIIIAAVSGGGSKNGTAVSSSSSAEPKTSTALADEVYAVGQTASIDNCEMTVTNVKKSAGGEYDKPQKDGSEFVIVSVTIKNDGKDNLAYNPYYFKMKNSQGQITDTTFTTVDQSTALNSGDLASGGSVSGTIVFEEPKNDAGLILQYQDNVFADGTLLQFKCS